MQYTHTHVHAYMTYITFMIHTHIHRVVDVMVEVPVEREVDKYQEVCMYGHIHVWSCVYYTV